MALTTVGTLALLSAALSRRLPADDGPYAYARIAFSNRVGFANAWSYRIHRVALRQRMIPHPTMREQITIRISLRDDAPLCWRYSWDYSARSPLPVTKTWGPQHGARQRRRSRLTGGAGEVR